MTRKEQIEYLKRVRETLIYATGYETEEEKKQKELIKKETQKVKVLKKQFYNKVINVV
jgi:hypothetical protein